MTVYLYEVSMRMIEYEELKKYYVYFDEYCYKCLFYCKLGSSLIEFELEHCNCFRKILIEKHDVAKSQGNNWKPTGQIN